MYLRYGGFSWASLDSSEKVKKTETGGKVASPGREEARLPVVRLRGIELHAVTEEGCIRHILDELDAGQGGMVVTPNLDHLRRCRSDMRFGALIAEADLVVADGMPLVWASRLQGTPLPERVAGSDLLTSLSRGAAERGRSIFLLGGAPGTAEAAGAILRERIAGLRVAGVHCPQMGADLEKEEKAIAEVVEVLERCRPDIVYVGMGSPKQELLIERVRGTLPEAWWLGVGNSFSFLSGQVVRAPLWMQKHGLEWMHRLGQEPKRLFKRYVVFGLPFAAVLLGESSWKGLPKRWGKTQGTGAELGEVERVAEKQGRRRNHLRHAIGTDLYRSGFAVDETTAVATTGAYKALEKLRTMVLLGGAVRPSPLCAATGRSVLDLPVDDGMSVGGQWVMHAEEVSRLAGVAPLPIRVLIDQGTPGPKGEFVREGMVQVERDRSEYRGTGGLLSDLAEEFDDEDVILVANAAQILLEPLAGIVEGLARRGGDVSLVAHQDGTPSGVMLVRCGALRGISREGFVDMKEQALPAIAKAFEVSVMTRHRATAASFRSVADYLMALHRYHLKRSGRPLSSDPLAEDWRPTFAIVEEGATVEAMARIHNSVVLRGGKVEQGAVLLRSIVCKGGVVRRDRIGVDEVVENREEQAARRGA